MKTILIDAVYCFIIEKNSKFEIYKDMYNLLEKFQNKKIILTNADNDKFEQYGLNNMPYEVFTLKHNPEKTDPKYFEILLNSLKLDKNEVVYFEHNIDAVKSAKSLGINTYFYDRNKIDLDDLNKFLILNS